MSKLKIFVDELDNQKPFFVETTNSNMRKALEFQLVLADSDDLNERAKEASKINEQLKKDGEKPTEKEVTFAEMTRSNLNVLDSTLGFIKKMLHLNEKQNKRLDSMGQENTILLANRITMRMNGLSEREIKDALTGDNDKGKE